jgi:hypothetical protein
MQANVKVVALQDTTILEENVFFAILVAKNVFLVEI